MQMEKNQHTRNGSMSSRNSLDRFPFVYIKRKLRNYEFLFYALNISNFLKKYLHPGLDDPPVSAVASLVSERGCLFKFCNIHASLSLSSFMSCGMK